MFGASIFSGGISNSGSVAGFNGIYVDNVSSFSGGISNSGTIRPATSASQLGRELAVPVDLLRRHHQYRHDFRRHGHSIIPTNGISVFIRGSSSAPRHGGKPVSYADTTSGNNTFTLGPGYSIIGHVLGAGSDTFQLGGSGSGAFDLSTIGAQYPASPRSTS